MSRSFLDLCKAAVADLGIAGGNLASTSGNTNHELINMCNWVADADLLIIAEWADWKFMWTSEDRTASAGTDYVSFAGNIGSFDFSSVTYNYQLSTVKFPTYMEWDKFRYTYQTRAKTTETYPQFFSVDPANKLWLSSKLSADLPVHVEYWAQGTRMKSDNDTSPIPSDLDRVIVERAKLLYAERENAPEILTGSAAEFKSLFEKLESRCLPNAGWARRASNNSNTLPTAYVE